MPAFPGKRRVTKHRLLGIGTQGCLNAHYADGRDLSIDLTFPNGCMRRCWLSARRIVAIAIRHPRGVRPMRSSAIAVRSSLFLRRLLHGV